MSRVFAIANQKGGVGKTTTAINLAASLAANDIKVLVIDSDPQGNATSGLGVTKDPDKPSLYHVLLGDTPIKDAIRPTDFDGLHINTADKNLVGSNLELVDIPNREFRLRERLADVRNEYEFILIDCPPALDLLTLNALLASDSVLVPIQCEFFALEGISELMDTIERIRESFHHPLAIEGILLTMFDDRTNLTRQVANDLREFFKDQVFRTVIPRSIRLAEAPSFGKPILTYDPRSRGAESYIKLAKEILDHAKTRQTSARALGKGIGALLPTRNPTPPPAEPAPPPAMRDDLPLFVSPRDIDPNPLQPRRLFQDDRLAELAQSIKAHGIIQPLIVSRKGDRYQLVAGERRWRAAKLAHVPTVPIIIREFEPQHLLEVTLIENIQREDLNAIETAIAFQRMATELNLNAEEIGLRTGKDRSTIVNFIRLLQLPADLQEWIAEGKLTAGHGRCLLTLPTTDLQREVAKQAREGVWSVRQTERICAKMTDGKAPKHVEEVKIDPNVKAAIQELERKLGTKIQVKEGARGRGKIEIEYYSAEDLDRIYDTIMGEQ